MKKHFLLSLSLSVLTIPYVAGSETMPQNLPGDVNNNGIVSIADIVTLVNHIIEVPINDWQEHNADLNNDKAVTVSDITSIVDLILHHTDYTSLNPEAKSITKISDRLICDNFSTTIGESSIKVYLDNDNEYCSLQTEVVLPEGMNLKTVETGPKAISHQLLYNVTERGTLKIILVSFSNSPFLTGDEPIFTIVGSDAEPGSNLTMHNIIAANHSYDNYELGFAGGLNENGTDRVGMIDNGEISVLPVAEGVAILNAMGMNINIVTVSGESVKTLVAAANYEKVRLHQGIYIVTVGNKANKVLVK